MYQSERIGQVRTEAAEVDTATVGEIDPRTADAISRTAAMVNENHARPLQR